MKVVAIVQARMGSSRLPGKVLMPLGDSTVLEFLLSRLDKASSVNEIVVATTNLEEDDAIVNTLEDSKFSLHRGSEIDVLGRYTDAALAYNADIIVRITGDCPFVDPQLVDDCVNKLINDNLDYVSNCNNVTNPLPDGFDVEVFTIKSLQIVQKISIISSFKEHVTFGFFKTGLFLTESLEYVHSFSELRITLDYEEDFKLMTQLAKAMDSNQWGWLKISEYLTSNKKISALNQFIIRNASWEVSLDRDRSGDYSFSERDQLIANSSGLLSKRADQFSPEMWPKNYIKAKGQVIWAEGDNLYLDYSIGGIGATTLGFASDSIDDRVISAIRNGGASSLNSNLEIEASLKLIQAIPWIESLRYTRSGGEATTLAVRLGRASTGKNTVLFSGYHGWHDWYVAAGFEHKLGSHLLDRLPIAGVPKNLAGTSIPFEYGIEDDFLSKLCANGDDIGVVILEPMRYSRPDVAFLKMVREECSSRGIALIFDEISCGFRFNNNAVHIDIDIIPDMVVFSKSLGNGYPIACVGGKDQFMKASKDTFISSTTHTESVGFAAMIAVLDFYSEYDVAKDLGSRGAAIRAILLETAHKYDLSISTKGLDQLWSWSFDLDNDLNRQLQTIVTESMLSSSILFSNRFYATLGIDPDHDDIFRRAISRAFNKISKIIKTKKDPKEQIKYGVNRLGIY